MVSANGSTSKCRLCLLHQHATEDPSVDRVYVCLKNILSLLGFVCFEAELYRLVEGLKK
jgi:hypothetical protein